MFEETNVGYKYCTQLYNAFHYNHEECDVLVVANLLLKLNSHIIHY